MTTTPASNDNAAQQLFLEAVAENAPQGQFINYAEAVALDKGR